MTQTGADIAGDASLDNILNEVGGFGRFHVITFLLLFITNLIHSSTYTNYVFSSSDLDYRCKVPECDVGENNREIPYDSPWTQYAIPSSNGRTEKCFRYALKNGNATNVDQCNADMFDNTTRIECTEFIYASDEENVQTEFNIHCSESYKLALVGTINSFGQIAFLPFSFLSDRYGRLISIIAGMMSSTLFGTLKSFSFNYSMYIVLEFLESTVSTCVYGCMFVLGMELVSSRYRVLSNILIALTFPISEIIFGFITMNVYNFRVYIRIFSVPGLFLFVLFWIMPESVRWLLVTGRVDESIKTLKRIARINGKELSLKSIEILKENYGVKTILENVTTVNSTMKNAIVKNADAANTDSVLQTYYMIFKSKKLCARFFVCCFQWMTCCLCYYGLNLSSTVIPGADRYYGYIFISAAEIPGILISVPLLHKAKRRTSLFATFFVASGSISVTSLVPQDYPMIVLTFFVIGKASMMFAFTLLYVFTSEQWPTNIRVSTLSSCSTIGRIGSMVAPFVVILGSDYGSFSALMFGGTAIVAAISVLLTPETFSKKLPDTIEEAKCL